MGLSKKLMKLLLPKPDTNLRVWMRRAGYAEVPGAKGVTSYSRRLGSSPFPRFHCYLDDLGSQWTINLHLDMKAATYEGSHTHSGEYDGVQVEQEAQRLFRLSA